MCTIEVLLSVTALMRDSVYRRELYVLLQPLCLKQVPSSSNTTSRFCCLFWYLHKKLVDNVVWYIERERERVRPAALGRHKISKCFGPSLNTTSERDVSIFPFIAEMKIYVLWVFHTNESPSMQRLYMIVVIVRWQVVVLVFPETSPGLGRYCPCTPLLLVLAADLQTKIYG